jgi:hypothetical protein
MRTFPKSLAAFQRMVDERGARLRNLKFDELKHLGTETTENITVESRQATIAIIVQARLNGSLRVVVQGLMKGLIGENVALDGFYKHPDETVSPMPEIEFYEFD